MCVENENEIRKFTIEEIDKIIKASNGINEMLPELRELNILVRQNSRAIDKEVEDRKKEDCEIKDNYIKRFDKVDNGIEVVNNKVNKVKDALHEAVLDISNKFETITNNQNKFLRNMIFIFLGCSGILFITMIWENAINFIEKLF